jgi:hypothetical protein
MSSDATDNTMRAELLPCPFCGGKCVLMDLAGWEAQCDGCGCNICPGIATKEKAIAAWNRRADTARQVAELEVKLANALNWKDLLDAKKALGARRVAEAVAAERKACETICEGVHGENWRDFKRGNGPGRGNPHTEGLADGAGECADRIRARSTHTTDHPTA